jgi:hypothetical protein
MRMPATRIGFVCDFMRQRSHKFRERRVFLIVELENASQFISFRRREDAYTSYLVRVQAGINIRALNARLLLLCSFVPCPDGLDKFALALEWKPVTGRYGAIVGEDARYDIDAKVSG